VDAGKGKGSLVNVTIKMCKSFLSGGTLGFYGFAAISIARDGNDVWQSEATRSPRICEARHCIQAYEATHHGLSSRSRE